MSAQEATVTPAAAVGVTVAPAPTVPPAPAPPPGPAPVTVVLESRGAPLDVARVRDNPTPGAADDYVREPLCRTPCSLSLPPGPAELYTSGPGLRSSLFTLQIPSTGARAWFNAGRSGPFNAGFGLALASVALLIAGPVIIAAAPQTSAAGNQTAFYAAGGTVLGLGVAVGATGIGLMLANPVGVDSVEALPPSR